MGGVSWLSTLTVVGETGYSWHRCDKDRQMGGVSCLHYTRCGRIDWIQLT
jgi:hypothetical protein